MIQCMDEENLHKRLKKIMGQIQAIDRMVGEDVPCEDILAQINAAKSALHRCGQVVLEGLLIIVCVKEFSMAMWIGQLRTLPRQWNVLPICLDFPVVRNECYKFIQNK